MSNQIHINGSRIFGEGNTATESGRNLIEKAVAALRRGETVHITTPMGSCQCGDFDSALVPTIVGDRLLAVKVVGDQKNSGYGHGDTMRLILENIKALA